MFLCLYDFQKDTKTKSSFKYEPSLSVCIVSGSDSGLCPILIRELYLYNN